MPSNWSKIRDEWLDRTAVAKDDAKWALEALINSEEELFEIEQKIKNKEDAISQVKFLKKKVKETISSKEISLDDIALNTSELLISFNKFNFITIRTVSYTHLRAHET